MSVPCLPQHPPSLAPANVAEFFASVVEELIEPLPPALMGAMTQEVVADNMIALLEEYVSPATADQRKAAIEGIINTDLDNLANDLRKTNAQGSLPPALLLQTRALAR